MSIYGWTNEDGEPIMDGAAYRFEQALDEQYAYERMDDDYGYDENYEPDEDERDDTPYMTEDYDFDNERVAEDEWLDGSYEE